MKGLVRVGRCKWVNGKRVDPYVPGFTTCVSLTKSTQYGSLSPYELKDERGRILENVWQFAKVYEEVPEVCLKRSRYDDTIIWRWPREKHAKVTRDAQGKVLKADILGNYGKWRIMGMRMPEAIRYPVGYEHRHKCLFVIPEVNGAISTNALTYIPSRKHVYLPMYVNAVTKHDDFRKLKLRLAHGENLLIAEVDGPHQESMAYYQKNYGVATDFIAEDTMLATHKNLSIMLNDPTHPFGHGYCLAAALQDLDLTATVVELPAPENVGHE